MPGKDFIPELRRDYRKKKPAIVARLAEFRQVSGKGDAGIFEELCYCILTAGSSAKMGMRTVEALRDILAERAAKRNCRSARKGTACASGGYGRRISI